MTVLRKGRPHGLMAWVTSPLGIFTNGYWGHPAYKLPAEANLMAVAHCAGVKLTIDDRPATRRASSDIVIDAVRKPNSCQRVRGSHCRVTCHDLGQFHGTRNGARDDCALAIDARGIDPCGPAPCAGTSRPSWEVRMLYDGDCPLCMRVSARRWGAHTHSGPPARAGARWSSRWSSLSTSAGCCTTPQART